jgi:hypothetical protein
MVLNARATCVVLLLSTAAPPPAPGQTPSRGHGLWVEAGLLHTTERDGSASPLLYRGTGASYAMGYAREGARDRGGLRFDVSNHGIASIRTTTIPANAQLLRAGFEASYLRSVGGAPGRPWRLFVGAAVLTSGTDRAEFLLNGETRLYRSYVVSGAPAVRVELQLRERGALTYEAALPVVSGVTHPASDAHLLDDPAMRRPRWRGPASYRQLEQRLSYSRAVTSRAGLRTTLMSDLFADAAEPQRAGSRNLLSVGIEVWTRSAAGEAP